MTEIADFCGLACPMPLLKTKQRLHAMCVDEVLLVRADDPGALRDIPAWIALTSHTLVAVHSTAGVHEFHIRKGAP